MTAAVKTATVTARRAATAMVTAWRGGNDGTMAGAMTALMVMATAGWATTATAAGAATVTTATAATATAATGTETAATARKGGNGDGAATRAIATTASGAGKGRGDGGDNNGGDDDGESGDAISSGDDHILRAAHQRRARSAHQGAMERSLLGAGVRRCVTKHMGARRARWEWPQAVRCITAK